MSANLLDTNTVLLALTDPERLPAVVRAALLAGPNPQRGFLLGSTDQTH